MKVGIVSIQFSGSALALLYGLFNTVFEQLILIKASACAKTCQKKFVLVGLTLFPSMPCQAAVTYFSLTETPV